MSEAVAGTVERVRPGRAIPVTTRAASGVPQCKAMVADIVSGKGGANFYEGMGCVGGCVGGVITSYSIHYTKLYERCAMSPTSPPTRGRWRRG